MTAQPARAGKPESAPRTRTSTRREYALVGAVTTTIGLFIAWPLLLGRTFSIVAYGQTYTYPWGSFPPLATRPSAQSDQMESSAPWASFTHSVWRSLNLPLWDPHGYAGGAPFASNGMGNLYPVRVMTDTLLSGSVAHDVFVMVHVVLGALGAYWLCRRLGSRIPGSLVGAAAWATSTNLWSVIQLEMVTPFIAWLPLTLAGVDLAVRGRRWLAITIGSAAVALAFAAQNVIYAAIVLMTVVAYAAGVVLAPLVLKRGRGLPGFRNGLVRAAMTFGIGALLAGFVLVPTALDLSAANRPPNTWPVIKAQTVSPGTLWHRLAMFPTARPDASTVFSQAFLPAIVLIAALVGLVATWGRTAAVGRWLLIVATLILVGGPLTFAAYHVVPGLMSVVPARLIPVAILGVCLLAAAGVDRVFGLAEQLLTRIPASTTALRRVTPSAAIAILLALVVVPGVGADRAVNAVPLERGDHPSFPATPAIIAAQHQRSGTGWPLRLIQTQLVRADPTLPPSLTSLIGDTPLPFGLDSWGGYDSSTPPRTATLLALAGGNGPVTFPQTHPIYPTAQVDWPLVSRVGADLVFAPPSPGAKIGTNWGTLDPKRLVPLYAGPDARVFRLEGSSAQPYLSSRVVLVRDDSAAVSELRRQGMAGSKVPVVEFSGLRRGEVDALSGTGRVTSAARGVTYSRLSVTTTGRQMLVIPVAATRGWKATVNGEVVPIVRTDFNYIGVTVPRGSSRVAIKYTPPGWHIGWGLTGIGLLVIVVAAVFSRRARVTRRRLVASEQGAYAESTGPEH